MSLTIAQMALMSRLLDEALPLDAGGRRRWLDALAPEYRPLAEALRGALLPMAIEADPAAYLDGGARRYLDRLGNGPKPGDRVGPYQLIRLLGAGGMAEVWLAQRADGAFKRNLALKLPTLLELRKDLASRFARERDILAALEHPNIARLYDAGVSAEGLPYLAMEYVAGEPLTGWCDAHQLDVRQRVKLFLQVLDAVQYAHSQRVIHRDIKPSNILVTASGQVRLLDFGVAKLMIQEEPQVELTRRYGGAMTPDYASPEVVRGEQIGAPSDIYSLGVLLFELLSGSRPYHLAAGTSMLQLERAISCVEVPRPSTRLAPDAGAKRATTQYRLARRLKGDLDAIVLKALAKLPASRYEGASAFADDLQRNLSGDPVDARPAHLVYYASKFVRRHRSGFRAIAASLLLAGGLGYGLIRSGALPLILNLSSIASPPGDRSIAVLPFNDLSERKDEEYFSEGLSEELIDHLVHSADLKVIARTSSFQFKDRNEDVRSIGRLLGVSHVLEGSVRRSGQQLRITAQLIRASDGVDLWSQSYDGNLSDVFQVQNEIAEKVSRALQVALRGAQASARSAPDIRAYDLVLEGNFFKARLTPGDIERAVELYRQAIDVDTRYALAWARLGSAYLAQEVLSGPLSQVRSSRVVDALDHAIRIDPNLAWAYYTRAGFEMYSWNWAAAQADTERVRKIDPRFELLPAAFGDLALVRGDPDKAVEQYQEELARDPLDPSTLNDLGTALCAAGELGRCLQARLNLARMHPDFGGVSSAVGIARLHLGQLAAALEVLQGERNDDYRLGGMAMVYWAMGRRKDSDAALSSLTDRFAAIDAYEIASVHAYRGEIDVAFGWLDRAYRAHESGMTTFAADPLLRNLRGDPRFRELLNRMGLAGSSSASKTQRERSEHGIQKARPEETIRFTSERPDEAARFI